MRISDWSSDVCSSDLGMLQYLLAGGIQLLLDGGVLVQLGLLGGNADQLAGGQLVDDAAADLLERNLVHRRGQLAVELDDFRAGDRLAVDSRHHGVATGRLGGLGLSRQGGAAKDEEIGRASCRERVCQYV